MEPSISRSRPSIGTTGPGLGLDLPEVRASGPRGARSRSARAARGRAPSRRGPGSWWAWGRPFALALPRVTVEVKPVASRRDLTRFIKLPWRLYRNEPNWVPPLVSRAAGSSWTARKNPFFEHADAELFLAWRDGEPVGRISAHVDRHFNEFQGNDWGLFGFFECRGRPRGGRRAARHGRELAARARPRPHGRPDGLHDQRRVRPAGRGPRAAAADPRRAGTTPTTWSCSRAGACDKAMDLYMWELRLDKVEDKGGFHPMIHAAAKKVTGEHGVTVRHMRKQRPRGRARPLPRGLQRRLGATTGASCRSTRPRPATTPRT